MGSSSSKPARKLAKSATETALRSSEGSSRPTPSFGRQSSASPPPAPPLRQSQGDRGHNAWQANELNTTGMRGAQASEEKTDAVRRDAQDPQLLANLQKLGMVNISRGKMQFERSNPMLNILSARQQDAEVERMAKEESALDPTKTLTNRLPISTIVALLDARKECKTRKEEEDVAKGFDVDVEVMDRLTKFVNSPSIDANARLRQHGTKVEEGEVPIERIDAIWTEPAMIDVTEDSRRQIKA